MIAQDVTREMRGTASYRPLAAYILRVHNGQPDPRDWGLSTDRHTDAVAWAKAVNSVSPNLGWAIAETDVVQQMNSRARTNKSYHYVISFPEGETPDRETLENIEQVLSGAIGYRDHQRLMAVHTDTDNLHMHVAVNRVHPETYRCIDSAFDRLTLLRTTAQLEAVHGLVKENHEPYSRTTPRAHFEPTWAAQHEPPLAPDLQELFRSTRDQAWQARQAAWAALRERHLIETDKLVEWHKTRRVNAREQQLNRGDRISTDAYLRDRANRDHAERKERQKQERELIKLQFPLPGIEDFKRASAAPRSLVQPPAQSQPARDHDAGDVAGPDRFDEIPAHDGRGY